MKATFCLLNFMLIPSPAPPFFFWWYLKLQILLCVLQENRDFFLMKVKIWWFSKHWMFCCVLWTFMFSSIIRWERGNNHFQYPIWVSSASQAGLYLQYLQNQWINPKLWCAANCSSLVCVVCSQILQLCLCVCVVVFLFVCAALSLLCLYMTWIEQNQQPVLLKVND